MDMPRKRPTRPAFEATGRPTRRRHLAICRITKPRLGSSSIKTIDARNDFAFPQNEGKADADYTSHLRCTGLPACTRGYRWDLGPSWRRPLACAPRQRVCLCYEMLHRSQPASLPRSACDLEPRGRCGFLCRSSQSRQKFVGPNSVLGPACIPEPTGSCEEPTRTLMMRHRSFDTDRS